MSEHVEPPCTGAPLEDADGMTVPSIVRIVFSLVAFLNASVCAAQSTKVEVVPLKIGGVELSFPLVADETGVVPPAEGATAYVQAVLGKGMRFSQSQEAAFRPAHDRGGGSQGLAFDDCRHDPAM